MSDRFYLQMRAHLERAAQAVPDYVRRAMNASPVPVGTGSEPAIPGWFGRVSRQQRRQKNHDRREMRASERVAKALRTSHGTVAKGFTGRR